MKNEIYEAARNGGKHYGMFRQLDKLGVRQLEKSIKSHQANINEHLAKITNPGEIVFDWKERSEAYKMGLLKKWHAEIENSREQIAIIEGYIHEKQN